MNKPNMRTPKTLAKENAAFFSIRFKPERLITLLKPKINGEVGEKLPLVYHANKHNKIPAMKTRCWALSRLLIMLNFYSSA